MVSNGFFTGLGKPKIPAIISIVFTVLRIPMALVLNEIFWNKRYMVEYSNIKYFKGK